MSAESHLSRRIILFCLHVLSDPIPTAYKQYQNMLIIAYAEQILDPLVPHRSDIIVVNPQRDLSSPMHEHEQHRPPTIVIARPSVLTYRSPRLPQILPECT